MTRDPVCGIEIKEAVAWAVHPGQPYGFWWEACRLAFEEGPLEPVREELEG